MVGRLCIAGLMVVALCGDLQAQHTPDAGLRRELIRIRSLEGIDRLDEARAAIDSVLDRYPTDAQAIQVAERIYRRQEQLDAFLPKVARAVRVEPAAMALRRIQLRTLLELGRLGELRLAGERWLAAAPGSAITYREVALALRRAGDALTAERTLRRGLTNVDRPAMLAAELANIYVQQRRWSEAAELWLDIHLASPALAWDLLSHELEALAAEAAAAAASAVLDRLGRLGTGPAHQLAALAALYAREDALARQHARAAVAGMTPAARETFLARFSQIASAHSRPELVAWAHRTVLAGLPADSLRPDLARQVVEYELGAGDTTAARDMLRRLLGVADEGSSLHSWASAMGVRLHAAAGEAARAADALERHARLYPRDPQLPDLALDLAEANLRAGRLAETVRVLELVNTRGARAGLEARAALLRAYVALRAGDYQVAQAGLETAAQGLEGPERARALRLLRLLRLGSAEELQVAARAQVALLEGRRLDAFRRLRDGLEGIPPSAARPGLLLWAAELALDAGALSSAEPILRHVFDRFPDSGEAPVALLTLADALANAGRRDESVPLLEQLIIEYPESAMTPLARRRLSEIRAEVPGL